METPDLYTIDWKEVTTFEQFTEVMRTLEPSYIFDSSRHSEVAFNKVKQYLKPYGGEEEFGEDNS